MKGAERDDSKAQSIHSNKNFIFDLVYFKMNFWEKINDIIKKIPKDEDKNNTNEANKSIICNNKII